MKVNVLFLRFYSDPTWAQFRSWLNKSKAGCYVTAPSLFPFIRYGRFLSSESVRKAFSVQREGCGLFTEASGTAALCTDRNNADDQPTPPQRSAQLMEAPQPRGSWGNLCCWFLPWTLLLGGLEDLLPQACSGSIRGEESVRNLRQQDVCGGEIEKTKKSQSISVPEHCQGQL